MLAHNTKAFKTVVREGHSANAILSSQWFSFSPPNVARRRSMNTVLDDNKKLCLTSGEIISLTPQMRPASDVGCF